VNDSYNIEDSFDPEIDNSDNSVDIDVEDNVLDASDDDGIDVL
jgi:hypothetical protein